MYNPISTYRIQFNKEFTFASLSKILPYLHRLGIRTIYASPIFEAVPGSMHGYDVTCPLKLNPEIGTLAELESLSAKLKQLDMGWIQDIVPNHMAFHHQNSWLMDVLEKGKRSPYYAFFDIGFPNGQNDKRLSLPFLGNDLEQVLNDRAISLAKGEGRLWLVYGDRKFPLGINSYQDLLNSAQQLSSNSLSALQQLKNWKANTNLKAVNEAVALLSEADEMDGVIERLNADKKALQQLIDGQFYRLCHWQESNQSIGYRRFFTVNDLICLNMQEEQVFNHYHQLIAQLVGEGIFDGLRIDHIDGLFDPEGYAESLRQLVGPEVYIVAEKILGLDEELPHWNLQGTTGYDFLAEVNNLLTRRRSKKDFELYYGEQVNKKLDPAMLAREKKEAILYGHMQGELKHLVALFAALGLDKKLPAGVATTDLEQAIGAWLVAMPVYRFYGKAQTFASEERKQLEQVFDAVEQTQPKLTALAFLKDLFLGKTTIGEKAMYFYRRCMQFSGPLMAKGIEDTLMYTYNRLLAHAEVGDGFEDFGIKPKAFHRLMERRQHRYPLTMNATATHDTKRGEDARARLNVLPDIGPYWKRMIKRLNEALPASYLHPNDRYYMQQVLYASLPWVNGNEQETLSRLELFLEKALREAKKRSDWASPDEQYEALAKRYVNELLAEGNAARDILLELVKRTADFGMTNALVQLLLKFTCPGVPDTYQGTELWDLSLVDPDNRRPVDYALRNKWLKETENASFAEAWQQRHDGKIKLWLLQRLLAKRNSLQSLFAKGTYIPLKVKGKYHKQVMAFLRKENSSYVLVAIPLGVARICEKQGCDPLTIDWADTRLEVTGMPWDYTDLLSGASGHRDILEQEIRIGKLFENHPFALLGFERAETDRQSGLLMPMFSLPGEYGIGDLGKGTNMFLDFLTKAQQSFWQMLPVNPTLAESCHSPYCSTSAMAGNTLYIDLRNLQNQGLLDAKTLNEAKIPLRKKVDYHSAAACKEPLLRKAYQAFCHRGKGASQASFRQFCQRENYWLADFALFVVLKNRHQGKPWPQWPLPYRDRDERVLANLKKEEAKAIEFEQWKQYLFHQQWTKLKQKANQLGIKLIGDLPFYVATDSADVWANRRFFCVDEEGRPLAVAGVPPDAFSREGQLWGMPTYNWNQLKADGYNWWMQRLERNLELFDLLRLDHFRAFESYWQVPAGDQNAIGGQWQKGPGAHFFKIAQKRIGSLPFIAEDLGGDVEAAVALRMELGMSGMKVLQFAFGDDMAVTSHGQHAILADDVVYTGTHDTNNTRGWYVDELDALAKKRIKLLLGKVKEKDIAKAMIKLAFSSPAQMVIVPFQDVLGLGSRARINTPGTTQNNWLWRYRHKKINARVAGQLGQWTKLFGRA